MTKKKLKKVKQGMKKMFTYFFVYESIQNATKNCGKIVGVLQKVFLTYITVILAVLEHARVP